MCRLHMTKMLHMIKKFELLENLNKKLIMVKNMYLAKFLVKLEKKSFMVILVTCVTAAYLDLRVWV